jgi:hypothetical protein
MDPSVTIDIAAAGTGLSARLGGLQASVALGAFAGAIAFILASTELSLVRKGLFFLISFISGILCARFAADLLGGALGAWMPVGTRVDPGVGALLSSALSVKILLWSIQRAGDPLAALTRLKGGRK